MKVTLDVDATPQELREFLGLPNVQPLQEELLGMVRERMLAGATGFDPLSLMQPFLPNAFRQTGEMIQQSFWDAYKKAQDEAMKEKDSGKGR